MFLKTVRTHRSLGWVLILVISALIAGFSFTTRRAAAVGGSHYSILAEMAQPVDSTIGFNNLYGFLVTTSNSTANSGASYVVPVNIPDGAVVTGVRVYGIDKDTTLNFGAALYRYNQDSLPFFTPVTNYVHSSGAPTKPLWT